jgi:hypothetical protein
VYSCATQQIGEKVLESVHNEIQALQKQQLHTQQLQPALPTFNSSTSSSIGATQQQQQQQQQQFSFDNNNNNNSSNSSGDSNYCSSSAQLQQPQFKRMRFDSEYGQAGMCRSLSVEDTALLLLQCAKAPAIL